MPAKRISVLFIRLLSPSGQDQTFNRAKQLAVGTRTPHASPQTFSSFHGSNVHLDLAQALAQKYARFSLLTLGTDNDDGAAKSAQLFNFTAAFDLFQQTRFHIIVPTSTTASDASTTSANLSESQAPPGKSFPRGIATRRQSVTAALLCPKFLRAIHLYRVSLARVDSRFAPIIGCKRPVHLQERGLVFCLGFCKR
jgi:hypothetical protein